MLHSVIMPKQGLTMEEGKVLRWRKKEGERVEKGEIILEIETDKVVLEIEAEYTGILRQIIAGPDTIVKVTENIGYIDDEVYTPDP